MGFFKAISSWFNGMVAEAAIWRKKMRNGTDPVTRNFGPGLFNITTIFPDNRKLFNSKKNKKEIK